jgi:hypothetical protein
MKQMEVQKLCNEKLHKSYSSSVHIKMSDSRKTRWERYVIELGGRKSKAVIVGKQIGDTT